MGKSTCAELLRQSGVPVVDTDDLARALVAPGQPTLGEIAAAFGSSFIAPDGTLCRSALAQLVFSNQTARLRLEAILHPRISASWRARLEQWDAGGAPLAVVVIPLLFETKAAPRFDATVCVACTADTQQLRVRQRGWSIAELQRRAAAQFPVDQKLNLSDHVIWTEGSLAAHAEQIRSIFGL